MSMNERFRNKVVSARCAVGGIIPSRDDVEKCIITKETIEMKGRPKLVLKASSQLKDQEANAS